MFAGTPHHRCWSLRLKGSLASSRELLLHRERERLDNHERQHLGMDTPGRCIVGFAAGFGVFSGAASARWLGILIATISVFVNLTFIPFEP